MAWSTLLFRGLEVSSLLLPHRSSLTNVRLRSGSLLEYVASKSPVNSDQYPDIALTAPPKSHIPSHGWPSPRESSTRQARGATGTDGRHQTRE